MASGQSLSPIATIGIAVLTALVTTLLIGVPVWRWQQDRLQGWSSRPDIGFLLGPRKVLTIQNQGAVDIAVELFFTQYSIQSEERQPGNIYLGEGLDGQVLATFSPLKSFSRIKAGESAEWDMWNDQALQNPKRFYTVEETAKNVLLVAKTQYAVRIVFRNAVSRQKYVTYQIVPAVEGSSEFMPAKGASIGAPVEGLKKFFQMREAIRKHQAQLFDDADADLYR